MIFNNTKEHSVLHCITEFPKGFDDKLTKNLDNAKSLLNFYKQIYRLDELISEQNTKFDCKLEVDSLQLVKVPVVGFKEDHCLILDARVVNKKPTLHKDSALIADVDLLLLKWQMQEKIKPPLICINFNCEGFRLHDDEECKV